MDSEAEAKAEKKARLAKEKEEGDVIGCYVVCLCFPVVLILAFVIYVFDEISKAVARWFRTKAMRTQLLLSFGLLVALVVGAFIGIWAGSVFLLRDTLISKSKKFLVEQISLIASRFTSEVWSALARGPQLRGPFSLTH